MDSALTLERSSCLHASGHRALAAHLPDRTHRAAHLVHHERITPARGGADAAIGHRALPDASKALGHPSGAGTVEERVADPDAEPEPGKANPPAESPQISTRADPPAESPQVSTEPQPRAIHRTPQLPDLRLPPGFRVAPSPEPEPDGAMGRIFDSKLAERVQAARSARPTTRSPEALRSWEGADGNMRVEGLDGCYERRDDSQSSQAGAAWWFVACSAGNDIDWGERFRRQP